MASSSLNLSYSGRSRVLVSLHHFCSQMMSFICCMFCLWIWIYFFYCLQLFEDFSFGEYHLGTIHLSTRGRYDAEGHYECAASVPLPWLSSLPGNLFIRSWISLFMEISQLQNEWFIFGKKTSWLCNVYTVTNQIAWKSKPESCGPKYIVMWLMSFVIFSAVIYREIKVNKAERVIRIYLVL